MNIRVMNILKMKIIVSVWHYFQIIVFTIKQHIKHFKRDGFILYYNNKNKNNQLNQSLMDCELEQILLDYLSIDNLITN